MSIAGEAELTAKAQPKCQPPTTCIVIGMAGSGKTTFMQRIVAHLSQHRRSSYVINLDPAVSSVPYRTNIDIRDTIDYKSVMETYKLGPNGAIVTSLNLFATRFDQVVDLITSKSEESASPEYCLLDTPGQIEVFTWSASGQIITESLATTGPTVIVYVVDTPRSQSPATFMSNMTYACSIMYKTRLPFLIVFNKADVVSPCFAQNWMEDVEAFEEALRSEQTFMSTLTRSLAFVMDEFYRNIRTVSVSAATGLGVDEFFRKIDECAEEYRTDYLPFIEARLREKQEQVEALKRERFQQVQAQMNADDVVVDGKRSGPSDQPESTTDVDRDEQSDSGSDSEPFDNFDYEQDRRDYEEYMAELRQRGQLPADDQ